MSHHYIESGLDNVVLLNGYQLTETPYGLGVFIHNVDALHDAIGRSLIHQRRSLDGAALRFLRIEMDLTQARLAILLGAEEQTLRRWEKARTKPIPGPADRILRALYGEHLGEDGNIRHMVERLADEMTDDPSVSAPQHLHFKQTRNGWMIETKTLVVA